MQSNLISLILLIPVAGAILLTPFLGTSKKNIQKICVIFSASTMSLVFYLFSKFDASLSGIQLAEKLIWMETFQIHYSLGVDGFSLLTAAWVSFLVFLVSIFDWKGSDFGKGFYVLLLLFEATVLGILFSQDLMLFMMFWFTSIAIPYFMMSVWGGKTGEKTASNYFLFQMIGCAVMLLAVLGIYYNVFPHGFQWEDLIGNRFSVQLIKIGNKEYRVERILFVLLSIGFLMRMGLVPFHAWLPQAIKDAPAPVALLLSTLFVQTGVYGLVRWSFPLFTWSANNLSLLMTIIALINIIYAILCSMSQKDLRKLVAYLAISQNGFILLGFSIFDKASFLGSTLHMMSVSIAISIMLFLIGIVGNETKQFELINKNGGAVFGGLWKRTPYFSVFFTFAIILLIGIPGMVSFPSFMMIFLGSFTKHWMVSLISLLGVLLISGCVLWVYRKLLLGEPNDASEKATDLSLINIFCLSPLALGSILFGLFPAPILGLMNPFVKQILDLLEKGK